MEERTVVVSHLLPYFLMKEFGKPIIEAFEELIYLKENGTKIRWSKVWIVGENDYVYDVINNPFPMREDFLDLIKKNDSINPVFLITIRQPEGLDPHLVIWKVVREIDLREPKEADFDFDRIVGLTPVFYLSPHREIDYMIFEKYLLSH